MGKTTGIEYLDSTVNAVMGCTGCELYPRHCFANALCRMRAGRPGWPADFNRPEYFPHRLDQALAWPDLTGTERPEKPWLNGLPRVIFVNDLGDGFCPDTDPERWLTPHLSKLEKSRHIWFFLTKWPERMHDYFESKYYALPENFAVGTSILRQRDLHKLTALLWIRAKMRVVSFEPLLERVSLWSFNYKSYDFSLVIGGETGTNARPMYPVWVRSLIGQAQASRSRPVFFKHWGSALKLDDPNERHCLDGVELTGVPWVSLWGKEDETQLSRYHVQD